MSIRFWVMIAILCVLFAICINVLPRLYVRSYVKATKPGFDYSTTYPAQPTDEELELLYQYNKEDE